MDNKGFTLVEMLVVIGIMGLLSGLAIVYSHVGQNQISLSIEESKIAQLILEAKQLSVATYGTDTATCAYGLQFNYATSTYSTYSLFAYDSAASSTSGGRLICPSIASTSAAFVQADVVPYQSGTWQIPVAQGVVLIDNGAASDTIQDILFYPPDPCTLISLDGQTFQSNCNSGGNNSPPAESNVYLSTADGSLSRTITVNPAGQVNL
jgi:prepilin-type N-terminal cleavage/methylation domain-containing protein